VAASDEMAGFAEARYFGWSRLEADQQFPIKGHSLNAEKILGNKRRAAPRQGLFVSADAIALGRRELLARRLV
jgi:hypothetical protein